MNQYRERTYRHHIHHERLVAFEVAVKETDLLILADSNLAKLAEEAIYSVRGPLEGYIAKHPEFLNAMLPLPYDHLAPLVVRKMLSAAQDTGSGPMAAVAGAIAEQVGSALLEASTEVVVENGGDCFIKVSKPLQVSIFAGKSALSERLALQIKPENTPLGVCTSSGRVGHSLSLGQADAVTVTASSAAVADSAATMICNQVQGEEDVQKALDYAKQIESISGVLIIVGNQMGAWGDIELVPVL